MNALFEHDRLLGVRLGYGPDQRLLIVHADDLAIAHAVNAAIIKGLGTGLINSASVMVPCPWFSEVAAFAGSPRGGPGHPSYADERANGMPVGTDGPANGGSIAR